MSVKFTDKLAVTEENLAQRRAFLRLDEGDRIEKFGVDLAGSIRFFLPHCPFKAECR